jgi:hypothetical protein
MLQTAVRDRNSKCQLGGGKAGAEQRHQVLTQSKLASA